MTTTRRDRARQRTTDGAVRASRPRAPLDALHPLSSYADAPVPTIVRGEGARIFDVTRQATSTGWPGCSSCRPGTAGVSWPRPPRKQAERARVLPAVVLRAPAGDRARRPAGRLRARRPEQGLLHHRRRRGGRDRVEAGQAVLQARRQADEAQGDQPRDRLPRHPAGRAVDHRHPGRARSSSSRWCRARTRCRTPTSTARPSTATTSRRSAAGPPTRSSTPSRWRAPDTVAVRVPRAGAELRRLLPAAARLLPAGARDLRPSTTCCWSPTR